jgi:hypothetical protein
MSIDLLSVVTLQRDIPERGLHRGEMGTVVEILAPDVFEVEFLGEDGRTLASVAIRAVDLTTAAAMLRKH